MKKEDRRIDLFLEDILLSMLRISQYIESLNYINFKANQLVLDAVIRNLEIIGEASKALPDTLKQDNAHIPWEKMYRLRNIVSHHYFGIDYEMIWEIITEYLPHNQADIEILLEQIKSENK
jgi:uncharacterized protein with HEPN domain